MIVNGRGFDPPILQKFLSRKFNFFFFVFVFVIFTFSLLFLVFAGCHLAREFSLALRITFIHTFTLLIPISGQITLSH